LPRDFGATLTASAYFFFLLFFPYTKSFCPNCAQNLVHHNKGLGQNYTTKIYSIREKFGWEDGVKGRRKRDGGRVIVYYLFEIKTVNNKSKQKQMRDSSLTLSPRAFQTYTISPYSH